jgi:tRNA threonylcarbamoyladenosine biosynthesis protein TsaE
MKPMATTRAGRSIVVRTQGPDETRAAAAVFARALPGGATISLEGPLGAGKTVFVRGFCEALGVTEAVTSPSYTLWNEYHTADGHVVAHLDCFRLTGAGELEDLGLEDRRDPAGFVLVEWGDRALAALPADTVRVRLDPDPDRAESVRVLHVRVPEGVALAGDLPVSPGEEEVL